MTERLSRDDGMLLAEPYEVIWSEVKWSAYLEHIDLLTIH